MAKKTLNVPESDSSGNQNEGVEDALNNALSLISNMDSQIASLNEQIEQLRSQLSNNRS